MVGRLLEKYHEEQHAVVTSTANFLSLSFVLKFVVHVSSVKYSYSLQFIYLYSASIKADYVIPKALNRKIMNIKRLKTF